MLGRFTRAATCGCALFVAGCGAIYTSPKVSTDDSAIAPVEVVEFSLQSIAEANSDPYVPNALPDAFQKVASTQIATNQAGLPTPPDIARQSPREPERNLPPETEPKPYRLGPGDRLRLSGSILPSVADSSGASGQSGSYTVQPNGDVALPGIGRIKVGGLAIEEANARLAETLRSNRLDPDRVFEVSEFNARTVAVGGDVKTPKPVPVTFTPLTLSVAIAAAGGAEVAERDFATIRILREGKLYAVPLKLLFEESDTEIVLQEGDSVFVEAGYDPEKAQEFFRNEVERRQFSAQMRRDALAEIDAMSSLQRSSLNERRDLFERRLELGAEGRDYVYVVGEVDRAKEVPLSFERRTVLSRVLFSNVEMSIETADLSHVYVLRIAPSGKSVTAYHLDGNNAANLAFATRFEMRPNDLVFIQEQPVTSWNRVLSQLSLTLVTSAAPSGG